MEMLSIPLQNLYSIHNLCNPLPPSNWSREVPKDPRYAKMWKLLEAFLQSPEEQVFDFRQNQEERSAMESAIAKVEIDIRIETIKKGSPHTLRIIKTQIAYDKQMKEWKGDVILLDRLENQFH